jgi:hypothetical protein
MSKGNDGILFLTGADKTPADRVALGGGGGTCRILEFVAKILGLKSVSLTDFKTEISLTEDSILRRSGVILLMVMEEEPVK